MANSRSQVGASSAAAISETSYCPAHLKMLSLLTRRYLVLAANLNWLGGGAPTRFYNCKGGKTPEVKGKSSFVLRQAYENINTSVNIFYMFFVAYRLLYLSHHDADLSVIVQTSYVLICYTVSVVLDFQTVMRGDVTPYFIAEYMKFFKEIETKYVAAPELSRKGKKEKKGSLVKCNVFLSVLFVVGNLIYLQNFLLMRKKPETPHFLTSVLEGEYQNKIVLKAPLMLIQSWVWYNLWSNIYFYIFPIYVYACAGILILKELNPRFRGHRTTSRLRETTQFLQNFNKFRVLHTIFVDSYRIWVQPTQKSITMGIATLALYGVIRLDGRQARIMGFAASFCLLYLASVYRKLGLLYETSVNLRETWLYDVPGKSSKWLKKKMTSCRVLRIHVGQYYYVHKTTVVTILYTILNGTITLLLG